jgi:hypothetical protein
MLFSRHVFVPVKQGFEAKSRSFQPGVEKLRKHWPIRCEHMGYFKTPRLAYGKCRPADWASADHLDVMVRYQAVG